MSDTQDKIYNEILGRLQRIEEVLFPEGQSVAPKAPKPKTIRELLGGKSFKNGQQRVAFVVGYLEKNQGHSKITPDVIKATWAEAKFDDAFAYTFVGRAVESGLIADYKKNGQYELTQTGEAFFDASLCA